MAMRVRLDDGQEIMVETDDPQAAAAAGRKYQENMKGGLANDVLGGAAKIRQGVSLNTSDELAGAGAGAKDALRGQYANSGGANLDFMIDNGREPTMGERLQNVMKDFQGGFQRGREKEQALQQNFDARRPNVGLALEIGSSFAPFGLAKGAMQIGGMAAFNGGMSGDNLEERATNAGIGGAAGFGITKALEKAGPALGNMFSAGADKLATRVGQYADDEARAALGGQQMKEAADRGITMTRGQQTGDEAQIAFEQAARRGARGGWAQNTLKPVFDEQENQVSSAIMKVAGDGAPLQTPSAAGAIVQQGLREAEGSARKGVDKAYGLVRDMGGEVPRGTGASLLGSVEQTLAGRNIDFSFRSAKSLTPETYRAYDAVKQLAEKMTGKASQTSEGFPFTNVQGIIDPPIPLSLIEQTRKLVNIAADNASAAAKMTGRREDQAAALAIRDSFDDWLDDAIDTRVLSNDVEALDALKWARGTHKAYAEKFRSNAAIRNILTKAEDETQVLNALFGVAGLGNPKGAAEAVDIIATQAPEGFQALRQAGLMRMTEGLSTSIRQGNKTDFRQLDRLMGDMLDGKGKAVMQKLYWPDELAELQAIRKIVQKLIPPQGTVNTTASGYEGSRAVQFVFNAFRGLGGARTVLNIAADAFNAGSAKAALRAPGAPVAPLPGASGRIAAMQGAGNAARQSPSVAGPLSNLFYEDQR
mgnify:CR=1 FL=1